MRQILLSFTGLRLSAGAKADDTTTARGREAEGRAAAYLASCGLREISRNFRVRGGEIDLIFLDGKVLVFVEVRQRSRSDFGGAAASIGAFFDNVQHKARDKVC